MFSDASVRRTHRSPWTSCPLHSTSRSGSCIVPHNQSSYVPVQAPVPQRNEKAVADTSMPGHGIQESSDVRNVTCGCEPMRTVPRSMPHPSHTSDLRSPRHCRSCRTKTKPARAWPPARCCSTCIGRGGHVPFTCPWCMRVRWKGAEKKSTGKPAGEGRGHGECHNGVRRGSTAIGFAASG